MIFITSFLPILGYILGAIALLMGAGAFKWWIVGLIVGTWFSRGAISMALQGKAAGDYPESSVTFTIFVHWVCLIGLIVCSGLAILR
jgi:hypothetical protein